MFKIQILSTMRDTFMGREKTKTTHTQKPHKRKPQHKPRTPKKERTCEVEYLNICHLKKALTSILSYLSLWDILPSTKVEVKETCSKNR